METINYLVKDWSTDTYKSLMLGKKLLMTHKEKCILIDGTNKGKIRPFHLVEKNHQYADTLPKLGESLDHKEV